MGVERDFFQETPLGQAATPEAQPKTELPPGYVSIDADTVAIFGQEFKITKEDPERFTIEGPNGFRITFFASTRKVESTYPGIDADPTIIRNRTTTATNALEFLRN